MECSISRVTAFILGDPLVPDHPAFAAAVAGSGVENTCIGETERRNIRQQAERFLERLPYYTR